MAAKGCIVGGAPYYRIFWWLSSILLQVFWPMCVLYYNI